MWLRPQCLQRVDEGRLSEEAGTGQGDLTRKSRVGLPRDSSRPRGLCCPSSDTCCETPHRLTHLPVPRFPHL